MGGFAGTGLVFGREFLDQSFLDIDDAKQNLEQPVLGAISRITTEEEIEKERHKEVSYISAFLVVSFVLIILSMVISIMRR